MKQPGVIFIFVIFLATVSFVLARQEYAPVLIARLSALRSTAAAKTDLQITLRSSFSRSEVCYELRPTPTQDPAAVKINSGSPDGPEFVQLGSSESSSGAQCAAVERTKLLEMVKNPNHYFINVDGPTLEHLTGQLNQQ